MARTSIGIDIGTETVKIVCLSKEENSCRLAGYGFLVHRGDKNRLMKFIDEARLKSSDIRINIEDPSLKIRRLDLPKMEENEIAESVKWGLKDFVEGDVDDFMFRYISISPEDVKLKDKIPLVVYVLRGESVDNRINFAREIGLRNPRIIEPDSSAIASIFEFCKGKERETNQVLLDLGSHMSHFVVMGKKGLVFARPLIGISDNALIDNIARDLGLDTKKAEMAKSAYFDEPNAGARKGAEILSDGDLGLRLKNTVSHFYSRMAIEIQRSIDGYFLMFEKKDVSRVYICGGGAYYKGLSAYLSETLGFDVALFDPFEKINIDQFNPEQLKNRKAVFALACGLAVD